uniref:Protein LLP homolog n=1 Tax=Steinernema glaseri TaxID=37863 RepID=A0A1I7YSB6_9BILA
MAKSIRAKSRRRARAVKREQLQTKVMKQLTEALSNKDGIVPLARKPKKEDEDVKMEDTAGEEKMEATQTSTINLKTMKLADGTYPTWLNQKKIRKLKKAAKGQKTGLGRKGRTRKRR